MNSAQAADREYEARIRRAEKLIAEKSSASEILSFYKRIASFQKNLFQQIAEAKRPDGSWDRFSSLRDALDLTVLLPHFRGFLALVEKNGPSALAAAAREISAAPSDEWIEVLKEYWDNGGLPGRPVDAFAQFFGRAFLEPYAMYVAQRTAEPVLAAQRLCPLCEAQPMMGVLRVEGDSGRRSLICSFCGHEWNFRRIFCPACGEENEKKLPVYVAEQLPYVRVEGCETCKFYVRTIDLTKDGYAVPVVDDLAAVPLTLWAHEHGYQRLQPNLLGS